tara:strand:- start:2136 stop:3395 length:1260 start_codon:yes stop_codon:yes gene_type:complete
MSATQFLINATTRHAIFVERYGHGRYNDLEPVLDKMRDSLVKSLQKANITDFEINRLNVLLLDIDQILNDGMGQMSLDLLDEVSLFGADELEFNTRMLGRTISADAVLPTVDQLNAAIDDSPMVLARASGAPISMTISQAINQFSEANSRQVRTLIQQGFIAGETTDEITRKVIKQVDGRTKAQARALTSTVISSASNKAHTEVAKANEDILRGEQIIATLDTLTSDICISADKTVWPVNKGPMPPLHFNSCAKDTMVKTKRGNVPIQDVKVGDLAMTHKGRYKRVYAVMSKPCDSKMLELVDNFGKRVRLTDNHPVLTLAGWKKAGDVEVGDKVLNHSKKLFSFYYWIRGSLVKKTVLVDAYNSKTEAAKEFVSYDVGSLTAGVSSSVQLKDNIVTNKKIDNVFSRSMLKLKCIIGLG